MAEEVHDTEDKARARLLELLQAGDYAFSTRARREGKATLRRLHGKEPTEGDMVQYIVDLLESSTELRCQPQGDPPGSTGIAWQMTDQQHNIFVKLQILEVRLGEEYAYIQSLHESIHQK